MTDRMPTYARRVLELAATDAQLQELLPDEEVLAAIACPEQSLEQIARTVLEGYAPRPALAERAYDVVLDPQTGEHVRRFLPRFDAITYQALHDRVKALASAWQHHTVHRVDEDDFVCFLGFSGIDYVTVDLACVYRGAIAVPLQTTLASVDLDRIFTDTAPTAVAVTIEDLGVAADLACRHRSIRSVIVMDHDDRVDDDRARVQAAKQQLASSGAPATVVMLDELVEFGSAHTWEPPARARVEDRMAMLIHSSGSTGAPKGVIIVEPYAATQFTTMPPVPIPVVRLCLAPMNHFMGRGSVYTALSRGGTACFVAKADMSTLLEDFRLARPTEAVMFPRVFEMIHRHFLSEVAHRAGTGLDVESARAEVMEEMRDTTLGDRISFVLAGSAPMTPEVERFVTDCFPITLADGYGTTEAGAAVTFRNRINRPTVIDYRLRDVPELGYHTTAKPYPRGELCLKTKLAVPGYFKNPEATAALYDEDGFLRTGDIMEERGPDHLVYIDRRNDVLKLAQGEFVTLGALATTYEEGSDVIHQMYAYGNSARAYLLAVVVPDMDVATRRLGSRPSDAQLKALIREELKRVAQSESLRSFEVPRDVIVETEPFSTENGLLSSLHKRMRPSLQRKYGDALEQLYVDLERRQNDELLALRDPDSTLTVAEKVGKALEATLGVEHVDMTQPSTFTDLGGDSLGAAELASLLADIFGVEVPVNSILSPAGSPMQWARIIEAELDEQRGRPRFAAIHGRGARQLDATDLDITRLLDAGTVDGAALEEPSAQTRVVLLTGATGFLGRFLCLEWLERLAATGGTLLCLVRANDHEAAERRLIDAFAGDGVLEQRFRALAAEHLEVVLGDVAEARLGVDDATYERLTRDVDRIVHAAALVNHVLEYEHLFDPNVTGAAELIGLALTHKQKRIDFVSTIAVAALLDRNGAIDEDTPLRQSVALDSGYGAGYAASKWAAEHLLHSAHRRFGVPVNVFRCDMILPHRRFEQQMNAPDIFARLLHSVVTTGLAPMSFYELEADGSRPQAHYDGLPVDFLAAAVVALSEEPHRGVQTFHVRNPHDDDGISLDTIVDWIEAAGHPVERVSPYDEWLQRFEHELRALPDEQRQQSSLAVLDWLRRPARPGHGTVGSRRFVDAVGRLSNGPEIPHLTQDFIEKCLDDLYRLELIPAPESRTSDA